MSWSYDGMSIRNKRECNMDSLLLKSRLVQERELCIAAVCDGVGGLADGAYAASSTVKMLSNWFENLENTDSLGPRLREYIESVNFAVLTQARARQLQTACTLSCLLLWDGQYTVAHVGDSRIYTMEGNGLRQLTEDHVREGRLTAAVGHREQTDIYCAGGEYVPGQRFLLCSDGLYKRMDMDLLARSLRELHRRGLQKTLRQLTQYVVDQGERDNISAALLIDGER